MSLLLLLCGRTCWPAVGAFSCLLCVRVIGLFDRIDRRRAVHRRHYHDHWSSTDIRVLLQAETSKGEPVFLRGDRAGVLPEARHRDDASGDYLITQSRTLDHNFSLEIFAGDIIG